MSVDVLIGLAGVAIGSIISLMSVYLNQKLTEKREDHKTKIAREEEAISQVYSPLVFVLEKTRDLFAIILALKGAYKSMCDSQEEDNKAISMIQVFIPYFAARRAASHPKVIEDLLLHKAGLIESKFFYADLVMLQSYLSTVVGFLDSLIPKSREKPNLLKQYVSSFGPMIVELERAVGEMRKYVLAKTMRHKVEYKEFFDENKYSEMERYVSEVNKTIMGIDVPDWENELGKLGK